MFFFCTGLQDKLPNIVLPSEFANLCCRVQIKEENKATCDAQDKRKKEGSETIARPRCKLSHPLGPVTT
jgi:hypothetical protein